MTQRELESAYRRYDMQTTTERLAFLQGVKFGITYFSDSLKQVQLLDSEQAKLVRDSVKDLGKEKTK